MEKEDKVKRTLFSRLVKIGIGSAVIGGLLLFISHQYPLPPSATSFSSWNGAATASLQALASGTGIPSLSLSSSSSSSSSSLDHDKASSSSLSAYDKQALINAMQAEGWDLVAIYRGNNPPADLNRRWSSQVKQDRTVMDIFENKKGGFFVDLASNDASYLSNSLTLEQEFDWDGLCIEADPSYTRQYLFRKCQLVQAVVGARDNEEVEFHFEHVFGGIVGDEFDNNKQQPGTRLPTVSVAKLLRDFKAPKVIDYLSLDIEGAEAWVFDTFPWDEYIFLVITVERPAERLMQAMKDNGYIYMCDHSCFGDQMWIHSSLENMAEVQAKYQGPLGNYCPGTGFVKGYKRHNYTMEMIEKFTPPEVLLASAEKKE